jgi:hypothetical protein
MRKTTIQFTRRSCVQGRLGVMAAAIVGSVPIMSTVSLAQQPRQHAQPSTTHRNQSASEGTSSREAREAALQRIPFQQLTPEASGRLHSVVDNASYFRRMPTEIVDCDQEMFSFLVRHPEVIVNIWDVMDVTKVALQRTGPFQLQGNDGAGTSSKMDLVFGNDTMHIYFANGSYRGNLWPRELNGRCIVILHNRPTPLSSGKQGMAASMDVFMKLENVGADLVVKTLGPLVGKTADYNFTECASFFAQISQSAALNPQGMQQLAKRLDGIDPKVRDQFVATSLSVAKRSAGLASVSVPNPDGVLKLTPAEPIPELSMGKAVSPPEISSSRRRPDSATELIEDRVDSPTILLIGEEVSKSVKP